MQGYKSRVGAKGWRYPQRVVNHAVAAKVFCSTPGNNPYRMHDTGDIAEQGEEDVEPELACDTNL